MNRIGRNFSAFLLVIIGGLPLLSYSQRKGERVNLRKVGRAEARAVALPKSEGESVIEYPSGNGKFVGVASHRKGEWVVKEFSLRDDAGRVLWSRKGLPHGVFLISNQGNVAQRIGEWGAELQFFDKEGRSLGKYTDQHLVTAQGFIWDHSGSHFIVVINAGVNSRKTIAFRPDGSKIFEKEHRNFIPGYVATAGDRIFIEGRGGGASLMLVLDEKGNELKKLPWDKGTISAARRTRGNYLIVAPHSCLVLNSDLNEVASFHAEDKDNFLTDAIISPKGTRVIVKFRKRGGHDEAGFVVLDDKAALIGSKELRGKKLRIEFLDESNAKIETDSERYAADID